MYCVIFTSTRTPVDKGYGAMADKMANLAASMPGYLGVDSARADIGITVSYWKTLEDIAHWKKQASHIRAQELGKEQWYSGYTVRVCKIEHEYDFGSLDGLASTKQ